MNQEARDLKRHIKKLNRRIKYLEKEIENKDNYIKELENIEDNRLILYLRHIKEDEIKYFNYSCTLNNEGLLEYHICVKRKHSKEDDLESKGDNDV